MSLLKNQFLEVSAAFSKVANFPGNFSTLIKTFPKKITLRKGMDEMRCDGCWEIVYKIRPHEWAISGY